MNTRVGSRKNKLHNVNYGGNELHIVKYYNDDFIYINNDLYTDNQGSITMAINASSGNRTRHIEVHHHYVRQEVKKGSIVLQYVNTKAQLADMLTKPLAKVEHASFMRLLGLRSRRERLEMSS
jgi:hypothetical protein